MLGPRGFQGVGFDVLGAPAGGAGVMDFGFGGVCVGGPNNYRDYFGGSLLV